MDVGMASVRSFLPKESDVELSVGQIVNVFVTACTADERAATLKLSTKESIKIKQNVELNVVTLTPGTKLHVNVTEVLWLPYCSEPSRALVT